MNVKTGFYTSVDRHMNSILYRGVDEAGRKISEKVKFKPRMFLESKDPKAKWKSLKGVPVEAMRFNTMSECTQFMKQYEGVRGFTIHGNAKHIPAFIQSQFPNAIDFKPHQIDVVTIDIETSTEGGFPQPSIAANEILSIALHSSRSGKTHIWGQKDYDPSKRKDLQIEYHKFPKEEDMMYDFIKWWSDPMNTPDVITGWNTSTFDIPYLVNRITRIFNDDSARLLSPWEQVNERKVTIKGRESVFYDLMGIQHLDYIELFKKFTVHSYGAQESYRLDFIAELVVGENKTDWGQYKSFEELYDGDHQLFIEYNLQDIELVQKIDSKLKLLDLVFFMAYFGGVNYVDTLGTVAIWDSIIFRHLAKKHIAVPPSVIHHSADFAGGYVKEVIPGRYKWVVSFDVNSLYPSIIIQNNVSPETINHAEMIPGLNVEKMLGCLADSEMSINAPENHSIAANGSVYSNTKQGYIPEVIEALYGDRVKIKNRMIKCQKQLEKTTDPAERKKLEYEIEESKTKQGSIKIMLNSFYGACGSKFFRYFDLSIAEGITLTGQTIIQMAAERLNARISNFLDEEKIVDRVIAIDTDSNYLDLSDLITKYNPKDPVEWIDQFCKRILEDEIAKTFDEYATRTNAFKPALIMKREAIADAGIWTAKKKYILNVLDNEDVRYAEPKMKIVGIEAIKSSTPKICRTALKSIFKTIIVHGEEQTQDEIAEFKIKFKAATPEEVAFPRGVNNLHKYVDRSNRYASGTPINAKAAILHNILVDEHGLGKQIPKIRSGDKIKYIPLKKPNPLNDFVIGFIDTLPPEFKLHSYIDYDHQFQKAFLNPLELVLKPLGWNSKPMASLADFFS